MHVVVLRINTPKAFLQEEGFLLYYHTASATRPTDRSPLYQQTYREQGPAGQQKTKAVTLARCREHVASIHIQHLFWRTMKVTAHKLLECFTIT